MICILKIKQVINLYIYCTEVLGLLYTFCLLVFIEIFLYGPICNHFL